MKVCKICKISKSEKEFYIQRIYLDCYCIPCRKEYTKKQTNTNRKKELNQLRWSKLTQEEKSEINLKKKREQVKCIDCGIEWSKRKDSILTWLGRCRFCAQKLLETTPERKEIKRQNGLDFIKKFGEIPNAHHFQKGELTGEKHHNWGKFREKHPCWIEDRNKLKIDDRRTTSNKDWVMECKKRDGHKCKIGNKDCKGQLEVHHILSWKEYPDLRHDINNGITLCHYHHPKKRSEEKRLSPYFQDFLNLK